MGKALSLVEVVGLLLDGVEDCPKCDGDGQDRFRRDEACRECGGGGKVFGRGAPGYIGDLKTALSKALRSDAEIEGERHG